MKRLLAMTLGLILCGCSTPTRTWEGMDRSMVWTAMLAAANAPEYRSDDPRRRWVVTQNDVSANEQTGSIEVRRTLRRSLKLPRQREQHDTRELFFEIFLSPTSPSTTTFEVLSMQLVPVRTIEEANIYFDQVEWLLNRP